MSLTLSIEDLSRFQVLIGVGADDGCFSFNMRSQPLPLDDGNSSGVNGGPVLVDNGSGLGLYINFQTVKNETGKGSHLCVSTSFSSTRTQTVGGGRSGEPGSFAHEGRRDSQQPTDLIIPTQNSWPSEWSESFSPDDVFSRACASAVMTPSFHEHHFDFPSLESAAVRYAPEYPHFSHKMHAEQDTTVAGSGSGLSSPVSCLGSGSSPPMSAYASSISEYSDHHQQLVSPRGVGGTHQVLSTPQSHEVPDHHQIVPPPPTPEPCYTTSPSTQHDNADDAKSSVSANGKPQRVRRHPCLHPGCVRRFTSEYTRRVHMEAHKPKQRKTVPCTMVGCTEVFSRRHDRLRHEVSQHGKVCEWLCRECSRFFSSGKRLEGHKCRGSAMAVSRWPVPMGANGAGGAVG